MNLYDAEKQLDTLEEDLEWDFAHNRKYPDHIEDNLGSVVIILEKLFKYSKALRELTQAQYNSTSSWRQS
jgi:hypothetical protein